MQRKRGLMLGRPFGSPLLVHRSWLGAGALGIMHLSFTAFGAEPFPAAAALATAAMLGLFASVILHEGAHELARRWVRSKAADVTLFVFGGVARTSSEPRRPGDEAIVAVAGPICSTGLGIGAFLWSGSFGGSLGRLVGIVGIANLALAGANLLPGLPLDGGRLLGAYLWKRRGERGSSVLTVARMGAAWGSAAVLTGAWITVTNLTAPGEAALGLWLVLVGVFMISEASRAGRAARVAGLVAAGTAGAWARPFAGRIRADTVVPSEGGPYAVSDGHRLAGVLLPAALDGVAGRRAGDVMVPWTPDIALPFDTPLSSVLERLVSSRSGVLVVLDGGGVVQGVIDTDGVRARLGDR